MAATRPPPPTTGDWGAATATARRRRRTVARLTPTPRATHLARLAATRSGSARRPTTATPPPRMSAAATGLPLPIAAIRGTPVARRPAAAGILLASWPRTP